MVRCSIIIPVYNCASLTRQCLNTLLAGYSGCVEIEIIVVDDASTDKTQQLLANFGDKIRAVTHTANTGFARACNDGAAVATGEYQIFLNNDTIPQGGWLESLVSYADSHPRAAIIGSKLLFPNDMIQHAGVVIGQDHNPHHLYAGFPANHPAVNKSRRFQIVSAACMLIRRQVFEQLGGFDTSFHNGYEDVDLCLRLDERGYEVHYCHESVLYHLGSVSRKGQSKEEKHNLRQYRSRWAHRVQPDDLRYYLEDGLLRINHQAQYPIHFSISPLLALADKDEYERGAQQLLNVRSRQVCDLLRETIRLMVHVQETELRQEFEEQKERETGADGKAVDREVASRQVGAAQTFRRVGTCSDPIESSDDVKLRAMLIDAHEQMLRRDEEILAAIYELQSRRAAMLKHHTDAVTRTSVADFLPSEYLSYRQLIRRIRKVVSGLLPPHVMVIVVSGGDDELLKLEGARGWHFPQTEDGTYTGYHPTNSAAAITHLEELRAKGGEFLLFPSTAFWWLDYYVEFRQYLETRYRVVVREEDTCVIVALREPAAERR